MSRILLSAPDFSDVERASVNALFDRQVHDKNALAGQFLFERDRLDAFAAAVCDYTGFKHAYAVSSGTSAMHLAMIILDIGPGDEVWSTSMTFMGGISPVVLVGAVPVFFDLSRDDWAIDLDLVSNELEKASRANRLPKAIVSTDLYGQATDMKQLSGIAAAYGVPVISDSAEGLGAFFGDGVHAGKGAKVAILSFNTNKIITSAGGGMILSDEEWITAKAAKLANQARETALHYQHEEIGFNYRMSQISAAIGLAQFGSIEKRVARRRDVFQRYHERLGGLPGVRFMPEPRGHRSTRWLSCMTVDPIEAGLGKDDVIAVCQASNIETRPLWKPMHMQPVFQRMNAEFRGSGVCEELFATGLCLPSGSTLTVDETDRVIGAIASAFAAVG